MRSWRRRDVRGRCSGGCGGCWFCGVLVGGPVVRVTGEATLLKVVQGVVADAGDVLIPKTATAVDASLRAILERRDVLRKERNVWAEMAGNRTRENERLREALREIAEWDFGGLDPWPDEAEMVKVARAALTPEEPKP